MTSQQTFPTAPALPLARADRSVAIVGMACEYPDAPSPAALWDLVTTGRQAFRPFPPGRLDIKSYSAASVGEADSIPDIRCALLADYAFDREAFRVPDAAYVASDPAHWLALDVAARALSDAGFPDGDGLEKARTGVIVANTLTGETSRANALRLRAPYAAAALEKALASQKLSAEVAGEIMREFVEAFTEPLPAPNEETLAGSMANTIAGRIANHFDLLGGAFTVDGACASSLLAVHEAMLHLRAGRLDTVVVGAVDLSIDPFELVGFSRIGALALDEMRVFDSRAGGFWPGEGAGFCVLTTAAEAARCGHKVHARLAGSGISTDGRGGLTRPTVAGQAAAISAAWQDAGLAVSEAGYFEAHGTGTKVGDPVEIRAISGLVQGGKAPIGIGSIKANIGHTKAAAGMAGLIKTVKAIEAGFVPPQAGCDTPNPVFAETGNKVVPLRRGAPWPERKKRCAGVSAFGFGGINTHLVLEEGERSIAGSRPATPGLLHSSQLFLVSAGSSQDLRQKLSELRGSTLWMSRAELVDLAASLARDPSPRAVRACVIARTPEILAQRLDRAIAHLDTGGCYLFTPDEGVVLAKVKHPRIGLLFPGQAAPLRDTLGAFADLGLEVTDPASLHDPDRHIAGADTGRAQPLIINACLAGLSLLNHVRMRNATAALGHSLGEIAALHWASDWTENQTMGLARERGTMMRDLACPGGAMLRVACGREAAEEFIRDTDAQIACLNAAVETVLAGPATTIDRIARRARDQGVDALRLSVSHAFHTRDMAPAAAGLEAAVRHMDLRPPPAGRIVSSVTGDWFDGKTDLAGHLAGQLEAPVRFSEALQRLADRCDLLIEVGPGTGMTRLARQETDTPAVAMDACSGNLDAALGAIGAAWAAGAEVDAARLLPMATARPFDVSRPPSFLSNPCGAVPPSSPHLAPVRPAQALPEAGEPPARPVELSVVAGKDGALGVLFDAVASATGLPVHSLRPGDRFLDDLHLSSIAVAKVVSSAGRALGLSEFDGRMEFAGLTLAETAREITRVAALSPEERPPEHRTSSGGDPDGVAPWTAFYTSRWLPVDEGSVAPGAPFWSCEADPGEAVMLKVEADTDPATLAHRLCVLLEKKVRHLAICTKSAVLGGLLKSFWIENDLASLRIWQSSDTGSARERFLSLSLPGFGTYRAGRNGLERQVFLRSFPEPVAPALGPQDVILFTGGAGGIGAECAQRLAGTFGASLILMGRSPVDSSSVKAVLDRIARTGARVHYARADVTDASAVAGALAEGEAVLGPITGIVHAAGANHPARFKDLGPAEFKQAHAAKVGGLENVLKAVTRRPLSLLAGFGSIISEIGLAGEAHYAWANACLAEQIRAAKEERTARHCVCFGWSVWAGAGMGQDLGVIDTLARKGVRALALDDALDAFVDLLSASPPEDPLVFVTGRFGQPGTVSLAEPDLTAHRFRDHRKVFYPGTEFICETELTAGRDPGLDGHRFDGIPVLPAVLGIEAMAAAAEAVGTTAPQQGTLENVEFHSAVTVPERGSRLLRMAALATTPEEVRLSLGCPDQDGNARPNMTATAVTCEEPPCAPEPAAGGVSLKAGPLYGPVFFQSGPFARLDRIESLSARAVRATLTQPTGRIFGEYEPQGTLLPDRTAMDAGLHVLLATIPQRRVLPVAVQRIFWRKGGAPVEVRAVERKAPEGRYRFDVALVDEAGDPLEIWEGTDFVALSNCDFDRVPTALLPIAIEREAGDALRRFDLRIGLAEAEGRADARDEALAHVVGGPLAARLMRRADGKPVLPPGFGAVSVSHSARSCIAAFVDRDRVGIDVQSVEAQDWSALLAGPDLRFAEHLAEAEEALDFNTAATRIWCLREALFKAGIADRIQFVAGTGSSSSWFTATAGPARLASGNIGNGQECAVAIVAENARLSTAHRPAGLKAREPVHGFS